MIRQLSMKRNISGRALGEVWNLFKKLQQYFRTKNVRIATKE